MKGCFTFPLSGGCFLGGGIHFKVGGGRVVLHGGASVLMGGGGVLKNIADRMGAPSCPPTMGNPAFLHGG